MMPNTLDVSFRRVVRSGLVLAVGAVAGCSSDGPVVTPPPRVDNDNPTRVTLNVFGVQTTLGSGGITFANAGRYAVMPQFAATQDFATGTQRATVPDYPFTIGGLGQVTARIEAADRPAARVPGPVADFHMRLRSIEREEAPRAMAYMASLRASPPVSLNVQAQAAANTREFKVLSSLSASTYATVTARLLYTGNNILLYVDTQAPTSGGFSDDEYAAFGRQFDTDLFPIDVNAFGSTSDIDANGKTFVLFTPVVNRLTLSSGQCGSYVAGFFNGADLSGNSNANRAEIFYSSVPGEPAGGASCNPLGANTVRTTAPATFIHELQHMISYNQHVLVRNASSEDIWLNEGLSHIAEELGGKLYEQRYPCPNLPPCPPQGRASTAQIFPDSAQGFLPPNFGNAYDFFSSRLDFSLTSPTGFGSIEERGVAWLFLRWFADQKGESRLRQLVQTRNIGTANIVAVSGGETFPTLYADFLAATLLDDFPGATQGQISSRHQFTSRNLRAIYARLNLVARQSYPTPYPLDVADLSEDNLLTPASPSVSREMKPGSLDLFQFTSSTPNGGLAFKPATGTFLSTLNAQVTVVRLPN